MYVSELEALQSIQETYVAMNTTEQLDESTRDLSNVKTDTLTSLHALHAKEPKGTRSYDQRQRVAAELKKRGIKVQEDVMDEKFAHPNHEKLDANDNGKVDAQDFALLRKKKGMKNFKEFKESLENLDEGFSKPKGFVQINKDEHDAILKKRLQHEKEHGTKNHREVLSKRDTLNDVTNTMVANSGGQIHHGLPNIVAIKDNKKDTTKYYRQPVGGNVKENLDEAHKIGNKVTIHKGTGAGITGHIGEISRKFKGDTDPTYTIFHGDNQAITVSKKQIKAVKD